MAKSKTRSKDLERQRAKAKKEILERLDARYTVHGHGILVVFDPEIGYSFIGDAPYPGTAVGAPEWNRRDGGFYAEEWCSWADFKGFAETECDGLLPSEELGGIELYREAILAQFKLGETPTRLVRVVDLGRGLRIGLMESDEATILVLSDNDEIAHYDRNFDSVFPPCCAECIDEQHDVEIDGRCPHGRQSYTLRKRLF